MSEAGEIIKKPQHQLTHPRIETYGPTGSRDDLVGMGPIPLAFYKWGRIVVAR